MSPSETVRARACARLGSLEVELEIARSGEAEPDCDVATATSGVLVLVIRAREEVVGARAAREALGHP